MKAPENIPGEFHSGYTMNGQTILEYKYANDCSKEVQALINASFTKDIFLGSIERIINKQQMYVLRAKQ